MKKHAVKFFDRIIIVLLGILGIFSACNQQVEYGTPYGYCEVNGTITDKETSNPIPNIQVVRDRDTVYTDVEGKYVSHRDFIELPTFHLKIEDIDGEENGGNFAPQEMDVTFTNEDRVEKGDGHWYEGKFVKTQNIELEKRLNEPEYGVIQAVFKP
jgi:putative lipoprotein (rSAM/lipoprotein system)